MLSLAHDVTVFVSMGWQVWEGTKAYLPVLLFSQVLCKWRRLDARDILYDWSLSYSIQVQCLYKIPSAH